MSKNLQILNKNNLLIKSNYDLNLVQNRYFLTILYSMQKESHNYVCRVHSNIFKELAKNNNQRTVDGIEDILDSLIKKLIKLQEVTVDKKHEKHYTCGIISSYKWDSETDEYKITLDGMVYDILINYYELNKGYTPLNLGILVGLNNYYAQRFYELIRMESWKGNKINFTVEYLRTTFEIGDKYSQYTDFRKRVILPSIKVLNDTGKFKISYKENRQGRKVVSIDFIVEDLESRDYFSKKIIEVDDILVDESGQEVPVKQRMFNIATNKSIEAERHTEEHSEQQNITNNCKLSEIEMVVDTSLLERGFLVNFKRTYKHIDFSLEYIQEAFYYVVGVIMDKDGVDKLGMKQWNLFKKIFSEAMERKEQEDIENFLHELEIHHIEKYFKEIR